MDQDPTPLIVVLSLIAAGATLAAIYFALTRARADQALAAARAKLEQLAPLTAERDAAREAERAAQALLADTQARLAAAQSAAAAREDAAAEREAALLAMRVETEKSFLELATQALARNEQRFLSLANETFLKHHEAASGGVKEVLAPVQEAFARLSVSVEALDKARTEDKATITEQMAAIGQQMLRTQDTTGKLLNALRAAPKSRGRWGEQTLRNVLELAGLRPHADFTEQATHEGETGRQLRPDVIIHLPGNRAIVVDSKVALSGYLDAMEAVEETAREGYLAKHAQELRAHVKQLASKDYWKAVPESADFVILFIPGENFLAAAAERDPALIEWAFANKVIIATPSILIALAKAVAYGWRQEQSAKNAQEIAKLGRDLHDRLKVFVEKVANLGASIDKSVKSYNDVVGSLEGRVLPQARRFRELGAVETDEEIPALAPSDLTPRLPAPPAELDLTPPPAATPKRKPAPN